MYYVADVDGYLQDNKQIINLYDFYDQKVGENETAVFFLGSSMIGYSIYPPEINRIVKANYPNITVYDLAVDGDLPIERALEIQKIINAKPSLVIYGISYQSVADQLSTVQFFDRTKLVHSRLNVREDCLWLYNDDEMIYFTPISDFEKKKYLKSAFKYKLNGKYGLINYSFDPYVGTENKRKIPPIKSDVITWLNNVVNSEWFPVITPESTRNKEALIYNVKTLHDAGIPVVILNMPLRPMLSEKITDESRANFYDLLNRTGVEWYDLERDYDDEWFIDPIHASFDGALKFAPRMADLIIEQVEKDVIHYT